MIVEPVLKRTTVAKVISSILGSGSPLSTVLTPFEFGYRVAELAGGGGYSSSEVWVIDPNDNPTNNTLDNVRFTAGANDSLSKVTIGSLLTQGELDAGSFPIAQIGLYREDTNALVHAVEFRGKKEVGYFWNDVEFVVDLEEGVTYFFGVAVNGWTDWPEFNPDTGGSTVYALTTGQVLEDLGSLTNRTSGWMIPVYFSGVSTKYVAQPDGGSTTINGQFVWREQFTWG